MSESADMRIIARVRSAFPSKFGIPRQSGLVPELESRIVFEPDLRDMNALRGIEQFSHLWLIWVFSENAGAGWSPTVRPPRLGGNQRLGVFATRAPFRPNPIGLSCVRLLGVDTEGDCAPTLRIAEADLMDGTPILDIKPYIPYTDARPQASAGYTAQTRAHQLEVVLPDRLPESFPEALRAALSGVLAQDPRPGYQDDAQRVYGFPFAGHEIRFRVSEGVLTVTDIHPIKI